MQRDEASQEALLTLGAVLGPLLAELLAESSFPDGLETGIGHSVLLFAVNRKASVLLLNRAPPHLFFCFLSFVLV